jgi:hypothetical protein
MPVLFETDHDVADIAESLSKKLFEKYDFNEGQKSIVNSATYKGKINVHVTYDVQGNTWYVTSEITSYEFDIQLSHPEAVEVSSDVLAEVEQTIYDIWEYDDTAERGELPTLWQEKEAQYRYTLSTKGLFI